ncbi:DUF418 domain-containing protein [Shewanella avicenniae]|uniref:DUF418 domain-containing protein n=1 Tax=Shewanella avicenniae TaxID=2814294 RepID=A0ABX7QU48_9GAMM|nr:DUF418 domain-containing protein [Shewanella avicenniae]QSX34552.1 DUF418 domain-containing protein [Shewanella avicenniae]
MLLPSTNHAMLLKVSTAVTAARLASIDTIRGIAVLGILLLNVFSMGVSLYDYVPHQQANFADKLWQVLYYFVLRDRFMSLFAMLFGAGLYLQWQRFAGATDLLKRRMYWLLVLGVLHCILIWPGDILFNYAVCGLILLRYLKQPPQAMLALALRLFVMGVLLSGVASLLAGDIPPIYRESAEFQQEVSLWTGAYQQQVALQAMYWVGDLLYFPLTYLWQLLGLMLLGAYAVRSGWFTVGLAHYSRFLLPSSVLLSAIAYLIATSENAALTGVAEAVTNVAALPMSLWIIHQLAKSQYRSSSIFSALQAVGRMPLTLYIGQSVAGVLLFRHIAPELNVSLDWYGYLAIAMLWNAVQLVIASLWLHYFAQGPLESLWRKLAFGRNYHPAP